MRESSDVVGREELIVFRLFKQIRDSRQIINVLKGPRLAGFPQSTVNC